MHFIDIPALSMVLEMVSGFESLSNIWGRSDSIGESYFELESLTTLAS